MSGARTHSLTNPSLAGLVLAIVAWAGAAHPLGAQAGRGGAGQRLEARRRAVAAQVARGTADRATAYAPLILPGQALPGELSADDNHTDAGVAYDLWTYQGHQDEHVVVTVNAGYDVDLAVALMTTTGAALIAAADSAHRTVTVELKLPKDGTYYLSVSGGSSSAEGAYTLSVQSHGSVSALDWARLYPGGGDPSERYALLVGVSDYPGRDNDLGGSPLSDVELMRTLLVEKYGFKPDNILILRDVEGNREQIIQAFRRHLGQAGPAGTAVFYYSGHGMQMPDNRYIQDPEPDGKDEALAVWGTQGDLYGYILDDEMGILVGDLAAGHVLVVLDDCYSGTATRAGPEVFDWKDIAGNVTVPKGILGHPARVAGGTRGLQWRTVAAHVETPRQYVKSLRPGSTPTNVEDLLSQPANHILLAASADSETSAGLTGQTPDGQRISGGLFTLLLYATLANAPESTTFAGAMAEVRRRVVDFSTTKLGQTQSPQVEGQQQTQSIAAFLSKR